VARTAIGKVEEALELARRATQIAKLDEVAGRACKEIARVLIRRAVKQFRRTVARRKAR